MIFGSPPFQNGLARLKNHVTVQWQVLMLRDPIRRWKLVALIRLGDVTFRRTSRAQRCDFLGLAAFWGLQLPSRWAGLASSARAGSAVRKNLPLEMRVSCHIRKKLPAADRRAASCL